MNKCKGDKKHKVMREFMDVIEHIIMISMPKRMSHRLPSQLRSVFVSIVTDEEFLTTLAPGELAKLLFYNANPKLLNLTIKVRKKIFEIMCFCSK